METRIIYFGIFYFVTLLASAQSSGVYLNAADFKSGRLAYEINCSTDKHKIKLNEFLNKDFITVVHDKKTHNLKKKEIFGYMDCNDMAYRFIGNSHYVILNPAEEILLYKHIIEASKNQKAAIHYYFSLSGSGDVQNLTLTNLKKAFPDNHKFHDALDAEFKADDELANYDSFHKVYKVNRLYTISK